MEDHNIIACTSKNVTTLDEILEKLDSLYEIEGADNRLIGFMKEYATDLQIHNRRAFYRAQIRTYEKNLEEL